MLDEIEEITVTPEIHLLEDLLARIARGELRIPRFQRPFVWRPEQMLDLFDSIERGYPMGSLLIWETDRDLASLDEIAGLKIPSARPGSPVAYVLDGHQRLSTLYGCLRRPADAPRSSEQRDWMWWIYRGLGALDGDAPRSNRYRHWKSADAPPPAYLPMRSTLRTMDFLGYARELSGRASAADVASLVEEAEQVAQRIKSYKVAVVRLSGGSLSQAVEVFSRLDGSGRPMSIDRLVSALTYATPGPESLADRIGAIRERVAASGFGEIPSLTVFRAVLAVSGEDNIQDTRWEALAERAEGVILTSVENTDTALGRAVRFLQEDVGVPQARLVPYDLQIVLLTAFFHFCESPDARQLELLHRWFWSTSWAGRFAGANTAQVRRSLQEMKEFAQGRGSLHLKDLTARPFPGRFDMRSARVRSFILWELREFPERLNPDGSAFSPMESLSRSHVDTYRHVVTKRGVVAISSPANRLIMSSPPGISLKQSLIDMAPGVRDDVLASHGIPADAFRRLCAGDDEGFITSRSAELAARERAFMAHIGMRHADELIGEADIDTD
ncbi:DUF262 domain-containing protein [Microtetraspora niveoalba]|uniref:DUF262 domain-containing protein n=1 Tax=Microtetraspora niveoalba TaxID=46175 RepID=UPI0008355EF2|nr:DUF262 domain-containing protein [Microtetraspora niveoalba]